MRMLILCTCSALCVASKQLLKWMLARLKVREFQGNKQYCSELLAVLVQQSPANQRRVAELNGIDTLLQSVALYKNRHACNGTAHILSESIVGQLGLLYGTVHHACFIAGPSNDA